MNTPFPPLSSVERSAAGPLGRACVVVVAAGADELGPLVAGAAAFLLLEQAATPTSATPTATATACTRSREIPRCRSTVVIVAPRLVAYRRLLPDIVETPRVQLADLARVGVGDVGDRIREHLAANEKTNKKESFEDTIGKSISETMNRSINTALTVALALVALIFLGAPATKNFALVMLVGVVVGTFSSICRSAPLLIPLAKWFEKK